MMNLVCIVDAIENRCVAMLAIEQSGKFPRWYCSSMKLSVFIVGIHVAAQKTIKTFVSNTEVALSARLLACCRESLAPAILKCFTCIWSPPLQRELLLPAS